MGGAVVTFISSKILRMLDMGEFVEASERGWFKIEPGGGVEVRGEE